jgi:di/tripeptidase
MSARNAWDTLRTCWIDTYQGTLDYVVHDTGKNFTPTEFKQVASSMSIEVKEVPVEAHNSVGLVERYHAPLRRAYEMLREELKDEHVDREMILQMAVKAVNDSAGPDGIVPTLLVFGSYPRMTEMDPPSPSIVKRAEAIRAATKEVRRLYAKRQVNDALAMRNGPNTIATLELPLQSEVRV